MLRIACLMWYDSGISKYADINYKINKIYCDKFGYELIRSDTRYYTDGRTQHWEKIPLMIKYLSAYDYIIWIDADAHFYIDSPAIEKVIEQHLSASIIFSGDLNQNKPWQINSGFIIIKNSQQSLEILKAWAYNAEYKKKSTFPYWEQGILWYMYSLNLDGIRNASVVIPYGTLQHFYDHELCKFGINRYTGTNRPFVHHNPGTHAPERFTSSNNYYMKITH